MILVENYDDQLLMVGHAGYAPKGYDIVCEACTALAQTLVASIEELTTDRPEVLIESGHFNIVKKHLSAESGLLISAFLIGISLLADGYPEYIRVNDQAVKSLKAAGNSEALSLKTTDEER